MRGPVSKTCEACGQAFSCVGYRCWCGSLTMTEAQMAWIAARFQECLCPTCLGRVAEGQGAALEAEVEQRRRAATPAP